MPPEEDDDIIEPPAEPIELLPDDDEIELLPKETVLEEAERLVARSRQVSEDLFKAARDMPEYKRVLATRERNEQFKAKLLAEAKRIDARIDRDGDGPRLPDDVLEVVVSRLANRIAAWEHSPKHQKVRQRKPTEKDPRRPLPPHDSQQVACQESRRVAGMPLAGKFGAAPSHCSAGAGAHDGLR